MKGKLFGIGIPKSTITREQIQIKIGQPSSGKEVIDGGPAVHTTTGTVAVFPADVQFLVFGESGQLVSPLIVAKELNLEQVSYVRSATAVTGYPFKAVQRTDSENAWDMGATPEQANTAGALGVRRHGPLTRMMDLLVKPGKNNPNIVIAVPASQLAPGLYLLTGTDVSLGKKIGLFFAVQPIGDAERASCLDVTYKPGLVNADPTPTPCGAAAPSPQTVPADASQRQSVTSSNQPTKAESTEAPSSGAGTASQVQPASDLQGLLFHVQHRHSTFFSSGSDAQSFCTGTLSVLHDGTVRYDCEQTQDSSGRCDHLTFKPGSLKQVKVGLNGALHIASKDQGNFDFLGDRNTIKQAETAIAPLIPK